MNLLESRVLWSYDHELKAKTAFHHLAAQFSGIPPVHDHSGVLYVTERGLTIKGDEDLVISLADIEEIYLGFDEVYPRNFIKNFGVFSEPLRILSVSRFSKTTIYMFLDYNFFGFAKNQTLFNLLQEVLS